MKQFCVQQTLNDMGLRTLKHNKSQILVQSPSCYGFAALREIMHAMRG